jgi:ribonuclease E
VNGEAELSGGEPNDEGFTGSESAEPSAPQQDRAPARSAHREPRRSEPAAEASAVREAVVEPAGHKPAERPAAKSTEETPRPRRARSSDASATVEPKLERVVVTPDQTVGAESDGSSEPARRGWWQRRLGGG